MDVPRRWSLDTARALLPEVRARTGQAVERADAIIARREALPDEARSERDALELELREVVSRWSREMEALGVDVKGPWRVDFDNGSGCYCWQWPEPELAFFHGYADGFGGRVRIQ